jgi:hypothetical protein
MATLLHFLRAIPTDNPQFPSNTKKFKIFHLVRNVGALFTDRPLRPTVNEIRYK